MWYAVMSKTGEVIAECSTEALATGKWVDFNSPAGSVAPYHLQTFKPAPTTEKGPTQ